MAHLALGMVIGLHTGVESDVVSGQRRSPELLSVYLEKLGETETLSAGQVAKSDKPNKIAPQFHSEPLKPVRQANDDMPLVPLLGQREPHYFRTRELTEKPRVLNDISPDLGQALTGVPAQTAVLRLLINERGDIDRVVIEQSYFPEHIAQVVIDAFSKIKFHSGRIGNMPVKSQLRIEVKLESSIATN